MIKITQIIVFNVFKKNWVEKNTKKQRVFSLIFSIILCLRIIWHVSITVFILISGNYIIEVIFIHSIYESWLFGDVILSISGLALVKVKRLFVWWGFIVWNVVWVYGLHVWASQIAFDESGCCREISSMSKVNISDWQVRAVSLRINVFVQQIWLNGSELCVLPHLNPLTFQNSPALSLNWSPVLALGIVNNLSWINVEYYFSTGTYSTLLTFFSTGTISIFFSGINYL